MASPYRDSFEAQRDRLKALDQQIEQMEESFTELFWTEVASTVGLASPGNSLQLSDDAAADELNKVVSEREQRLGALQSVEASFAQIDAAWRTPASQVPPIAAPPIIDIGGAISRMFTEDPYLPKFERVVKELNPAIDVEVREGVATTTILFEEIPFRLRCHSYTTRNGNWRVALAAQTTIPPLCGELRLAPQGFGSELLIALRLKRDIKVDDDEFDGYFVISGDVDAARAMLTDEVRKQLMTIAASDIPKLEVGRGLATLRWQYEPDVSYLKASMDVLKGIREAPPTRSLKRSSPTDR